MIKHELTLKKGAPYPLGATVMKGGINFAAVIYDRKDCGLILYDRKNPEDFIKIPFEETYFAGNICCVFIEHMKPSQCYYNFYRGDQCFLDAYAKEVVGTKSFGRPMETKVCVPRAGLPCGSFDWEGDEPLRIPYEESLFYCAHVRGFTKNKKSGVKHKGTFLGLVEKLPYLTELGIRNLELQPIYEFAEWEEEIPLNTMEYALAHYKDKPDDSAAFEDGADQKSAALQKQQRSKGHVNYWGYKTACYFAPKTAYAAGAHPVEECKTLIRECHKNGIEVILQFYFPDECKQGYILEILKYWVLEYHIDGFHLMGNRIPLTLLATEPLFGNTKLIYYHFPYDEIYYGSEVPGYRNMANANDSFMADARKYLKGDENMLNCMMQHMCSDSKKHGSLHYITNYYGFTLADLVSYDRKHNEANGEDNRDGTDYNFSWNCGIEGPTRKNLVIKLRKKQMKNAMAIVMLSQGTPFLTAGDEDCNTQLGNNNPYCQDNEIGWKDWSKSKWAKEQFAFLKQLIRFRMEHAAFHKNDTDMGSMIPGTYPEISFHSEEAFSINCANYNRHMGILYAGAYGDRKGRKDQDIYIVFNMHWISHRFALPKLKKGYQWQLVMDTAAEDSFSVSECREDYTVAEGRSIQILVSEPVPAKSKKRTGEG